MPPSKVARVADDAREEVAVEKEMLPEALARVEAVPGNDLSERLWPERCESAQEDRSSSSALRRKLRRSWRDASSTRCSRSCERTSSRESSLAFLCSREQTIITMIPSITTAFSKSIDPVSHEVSLTYASPKIALPVQQSKSL